MVKLKSSLDRGLLLTRKLLNKEFIVIKLKSSLERVTANKEATEQRVPGD